MRENRINLRGIYFLLGLTFLTTGILSCQQAEAPKEIPKVADVSQSLPTEKSNTELVQNVTDVTFAKEVGGSRDPVLVDFWATWCGPCRMYGPIVDQLAEDYKGRLKVVRVDIDHNPGLARSFGIRAIPTSLLFKKGKLVKTWVGLISEEDLKVEVNKIVKKPAKKPKPAKT